MLEMYKDQAPILQELFQNEDMSRISGYVNSKISQFELPYLELAVFFTTVVGAFKEFAPDLYQLYESQLKEVMDRDPTLRPMFPGSVFACTAINFPPGAVSLPHRDHLNLAYGWCSITSLGRFNHKAGAHLVFPELKLAVEFPAGSTSFIPSAAFTHYNTTIQEGETRSSITQFSAGGIFRWTAYGHQQKGKAQAASIQGKKWWDKGEGLYEVWPRDKVGAGPGSGNQG
jgi:hypothetical protein